MSQPLPDNQTQFAEQVITWLEANLPAELAVIDVAMGRQPGSRDSWLLQVFVERKPADGQWQHIGLDGCEAVSRQLEAWLDEDADIQRLIADTRYTLEVSSPGAFRQLMTPREFAFYQGHPVSVQERPPVRNSKRPPPAKILAEGILAGFDTASGNCQVKTSSGEVQQFTPDHKRLIVELADPKLLKSLSETQKESVHA